MTNAGIIVAVPSKYEKMCLHNIQKIRRMSCELPIEIWEIGKEISDVTRHQLKQISNIVFRNINDYTDDISHWKGFQIKAFILYHCKFENILLMDADISFYKSPCILFDDKNYLKTGAYFFKDLDKWKFKQLNNPFIQWTQKFIFNKFKNRDFFIKRKNWVLSLLPNKAFNFPKEWDYIYEKNVPSIPVKEALQESGVVLLNRNIHHKSIQFIFDLNNDHDQTYQYVWGDKETFWIACLMAQQEFYFNPSAGYVSSTTKKLCHDYNNELFFVQKG